MARHIYPIGIQTFSDIIKRQAVYVDKTALIYRLVTEGKVYFLSRPRRFGKSLLISTLESYFNGEKDLFQGLAMESLENDWLKYPVFHFDFSGIKLAEDLQALKDNLNVMLANYEQIYGADSQKTTPSLRLSGLLERAYRQTGRQCVILIDEYDAPLLDTLVNHEVFVKARQIMRDFFSPIKKCDNFLKFVFLTGITKFSQLSIFSELNNLQNISMDDEFAGLCGITKEEMVATFQDEIADLAVNYDCSPEEMVLKLKKMYDGYHFSEHSPDIFNPFSLLNCFKSRKLGSYWFASGTPTFLTEQVANYSIKPEEYDRGVWLAENAFYTATETADNPIPVFYQSGYLTIKEFRKNLYRLAFPNDEVRCGFLEGLLPHYTKKNRGETSSLLAKLVLAFDDADVDQVMALLRSFLADIPYDAEKQDEDHFKTICFILCKIMPPFDVFTEMRTAAGRADVVVKTDKSVFCFEFKLGGSARAALEQIDDRGYLVPYEASGKKLFKIGVNIGQQSRTVDEWVVA